MSTSTSGWASRSFMIGMRLCPPASTWPRSPSSDEQPDRLFDGGRRLVLERGRDHRVVPPWRMRQTFSDVIGMSMSFTPRWASASTTALTTAGVDRDRAGLADALDAQRVDRRGRLGVVELEARQPGGEGQGVVHQRAGEELAVLVELGALVERLADALDGAAVHLPGDQQRADDPAAVVHRDHALQRDVARLAVDLDDGDVGAERQGEVGRLEGRRRLEPGLDLLAAACRPAGRRSGRPPGW